ncbi:MAG: hypothetical protein H6550_11540 [Chitinophagales bacterium]|nr:hypothetical protein [Chitinophagales bacterium]
MNKIRFHFLLSSVLIFLCNISFACTCVNGITTKSSYYTSDIVVNVIIIELKNLSDTSLTPDNQKTITLKGIEYKAVVLHQYKGSKSADTIAIDPFAFTSCEAAFETGRNYLVFANQSNSGIYFTSMCKGNKLYNKKDNKLLLKLQRKNRK